MTTGKLHSLLLIFVALLVSCSKSEEPSAGIFSCEAFSLYPDSLVAVDGFAKAISSGQIEYGYSTPDTVATPARLRLRFSINGRDNELPADSFHVCVATEGESPLLTFGSVASDSVDASAESSVRPGTPFTLRLDMRPVLRAFRRDGYYVARRADTIRANRFKGVWVAGPSAPLSMHFPSLHTRSDLRMHQRPDSIYEITIPVGGIVPEPHSGVLSADSMPADVPSYISRQPIIDAAYNVALSRIGRLSPSTAFSSASEAAHAVMLSLAVIDPEFSMSVLRRFVRHGRVVQDAGAGGGWPLSTDRLMWIVAAAEIFNVTGSVNWAREACDVALRTLLTDSHVLYSAPDRLLCGALGNIHDGGRNFPVWMDQADIARSVSLSVNVEYVMALRSLSLMLAALGREMPPQLPRHEEVAERINELLWIPHRRYYSGYLYCYPFRLQSPYPDNLGQALAVLSRVAAPEMASAILRSTPVSVFGTPVSAPLILPDGLSSSATAVLPYVQAYWNIAAASSGNLEALLAGLGAIYRSYFFSGSSGVVDALSGRPLAAVGDGATAQAAVAAMNLRVFAGIRIDSSGIRFAPVIPPSMPGERHLRGLRYRNATLDLFVNGTGSKVISTTIDGKQLPHGIVPRDISGYHTVRVVLAGNAFSESSVDISSGIEVPATPRVVWRNPRSAWILSPDPDRMKVRALIDGVMVDELVRRDFTVSPAKHFRMVQFYAKADNGAESLPTRPRRIIPRSAMLRVDCTTLTEPGTNLPVAEGTALKFIEISPARNLNLEFNVKSTADATCMLDIRYANGSGEPHSQSRCVIRDILLDDSFVGSVLMPCLGEGQWQLTDFSTPVILRIRRGVNKVSIRFEPPFDFNASGSPGTALLQYVRLIKID